MRLLVQAIDLCVALRLYGLGAWCCERTLNQMEDAARASEACLQPVCPEVFEQLLRARLR